MSPRNLSLCAALLASAACAPRYASAPVVVQTNVVVVQSGPPPAGCEALLQPGAQGRFEVFQAGSRTNGGTFVVRSFANGRLVLEQRAEGTGYNVLAVFEGSADGERVDLRNTHPQYPERWVATCAQGAFRGDINDGAFLFVWRF